MMVIRQTLEMALIWIKFKACIGEQAEQLNDILYI